MVLTGKEDFPEKAVLETFLELSEKYGFSCVVIVESKNREDEIIVGHTFDILPKSAFKMLTLASEHYFNETKSHSSRRMN